MMRSIVIAATGIPVLLLQLLPAVLAFSRSPFSRSGVTGIVSSTRLFAQQKAGADSLKTELLRKIASRKTLGTIEASTVLGALNGSWTDMEHASAS